MALLLLPVAGDLALPHAEATTAMKPDSRAPLRLLLVASGKSIPNWLFKCIEALERSGAAHVVLVVEAAQEQSQGLSKFVRTLPRLLFSWYTTVDRYFFRRDPDALAPIGLRAALPHCPVFVGAELPVAPEGALPVDAPLARALRAERIDVALDPFSLLPDARFAEICRYGVWSTMFGRSGDPKTQSTPAFWEVVEGRPTTEARLCIYRTGADNARALYVSVAPTDHRSVARSQNHVCWKLAAALAKKIETLWEDPDGCFQRLETAPPFAVARSPSRAPGNLAMSRAGAALVRRYVSKKWISARYREQWALAYRRGPGDQSVTGTFHTLLPPRDRYWADPFPIHVGSDYYLFHEELLFSTGKGSIVLTVVGDKAGTAQPIPILEKDYHLSYPFVFQWDGEFFMIPESAAHRQVDLYRCVEFPGRWQLERVLLSGLTAFDPTLAFLSGKWWLFANVPAYGAIATTDELHLFHADSPLGPWIPHRANPVKSDVRCARPAGRIFARNGQFYRPAQDCSARYGHAVSINRILQLDPETYEEVEVQKIIPNWGPSVVGVHTFNVSRDMTVIDCLVMTRKHGQGRGVSIG